MVTLISTLTRRGLLDPVYGVLVLYGGDNSEDCQQEDADDDDCLGDIAWPAAPGRLHTLWVLT